MEKGINAFKSWRTGRTNLKGRIPDELWNMAADLGKQYGHGRVADALNLNRTRLKEKIIAASSSRKKLEKATTRSLELIKVAPVTLSGQLPITPKPRSSHATMIAEIMAPSGLSIRMFSGIDADSLKALSLMIGEML